MPTRTLALALLFTLFATPSHAQIGRMPFLAVLEFRVENKVISNDNAMTLANIVRSRMVKSGSKIVKLISREKVIEILSKGSKSAAQCSGQCEIDTAREVGADFVLTGNISPLGDRAVLVLDVKKAQDGVTVASTTLKAPAKTIDDKLDAAVDEIVAELAEKLGAAPVATIAPEKQPFGGSKVETGKQVDTDDLEETVVKFTSTPPAAVFLGTRQLCAKTPCQKSVALGKQNVTMSAEDYVAKTAIVDVRKTTDEISWQLQADFATLDVNCGATWVPVPVKVDGVAAGMCPLTGTHLRPGKHKVALDSPCHLGAEEAFELKRGEAKALTLQVNPRLGVVTIKANDDAGDDLKGKALLDGKEIGDVPGSFKVPVCGKKLEVRSEGHASWNGELKVAEGEKVKVVAELKKGARPAQAGAAAAGGPRTQEQVAAATALGKGTFHDNGDGTVAQTDAGLTWQKADSGKEFDQAAAPGYCAGLFLAGGGWRLPTIDELVRLIDSGQPSGRKINPNFAISDEWFWSSSPSDGRGNAWYVNFASPFSRGDGRDFNRFSVRCVR